jgi:hypothetical protein
VPDSAEADPFQRHLRKPGLSRDEWQQLKELVLENSYGYVLAIPEALAQREVALLVAEHRRTGRRVSLDKAAALLVGSPDSVWLALDKS